MKVLILNGSPRANGNTALALREMENVFKNMVFLMKSIALGKEKYGMPESEPGIFTNFIR